MADGWDDLIIDGKSRQSDHDMLGLERGDAPGQASFALTPTLARFDGRLYGGTAIAVAAALAEVETGRPALWTTVQFIDAASQVGDRFDCSTEVLAAGRSAAQVRVTARVEDREIFCALGATAHRKPDRPEAWFKTMPSVPAAEAAPPFPLPIRPSVQPEAANAMRNLEFRVAARAEGDATPADHLLLWVRVPGRPATPAVMAYVADMVPLAIARAAGRAGAGTSLDNTLRYAGATADEWVLLELDPHLASGGYGHGVVLVWSTGGELLATGSQTAGLLLFD